MPIIDEYGNTKARSGCDRCNCGCKYWEQDLCIDCGMKIEDLLRPRDEELLRIARKLRFPTLEVRGRDSLDFQEVSVTSLKEALIAAFEAGERA